MTTASQEGSRSVEALDYDFHLSKLERVMSGAGKVAALGHELERRGLKRLDAASDSQDGLTTGRNFPHGDNSPGH